MFTCNGSLEYFHQKRGVKIKLVYIIIAVSPRLQRTEETEGEYNFFFSYFYIRTLL